MNDKEYFLFLLNKYLKGDLTKDEKIDFVNLVNEGNHEDVLSHSIMNTLWAHYIINSNDLDESQSQEILDNIKKEIAINDVNTPKTKIYTIALGLVASIAIVFFLWFFNLDNKAFVDNNGTKLLVKNYSIHSNYSDTLQHLVLFDKSIVDIYPNTEVYYPNTIINNERVIYMKGEAFFRVAPDSLHPFIVYSGGLKTSVLGTSFFVRSDAKDILEEVEVRTGKVKVEINNVNDNKIKEVSREINLEANQMAVFSKSKNDLQKTLARSIFPIDSKKNNENSLFEYEQEPLSTIFSDLENRYGITIHLNDEKLKECSFTGKLTESDLFNKLNIICLATKSTYKVVGSSIMIEGKGCK